MKKTVVFQWIPVHVGIDGNEKADFLAKKGTTLSMANRPLSVQATKKIINKSTLEHWEKETKQKAARRKWEKVNELWAVNKSKPRKEAVALFRLATGHDCLAAHLEKIHIYPTATCTVCYKPNSRMDEEHLLVCSRLDKNQQSNRDLAALYWSARNLME